MNNAYDIVHIDECCFTGKYLGHKAHMSKWAPIQFQRKWPNLKYVAVVGAASRQRGLISYWTKVGKAYNARDYKAFIRHVIQKCQIR